MQQQLSLFGEPEIIEEANQLIIKSDHKKPLTKNQLQFNKLTKRIESLEKGIEKETERCEELLQYYAKKMHPVVIDSAHKNIELAMAIGNSTRKYKFGKSQLEKITSIILDLCDKAFTEIEPTPEQEEFYNQWSELTYKEELEEQEKGAKEGFADFMDFMFGIDIDPESFEGSEEDLQSIFEKLGEQFEQNSNPGRKRKKTKKQLEREEQLKAEETIKNKSIKSIYIALAKILHPDKEKDPAIKMEKEEQMKKVTRAFEEKDLPALLKLELEWVHKETEHLESLTDEKLKVYISALRQQVKELEQKKYSIMHSPRYAAISDVLHLRGKSAQYSLKLQAAEESSRMQTVESFISQFEKTGAKKTIVEFVEQYYSLMEERMEMEAFDDLFY